MQDEVTVSQAALNNRSPLHRAVYKAIRNFNMGNMCDEDGYPYPLVDLMSNPAPADISTGEDQMIDLTDEIVEAIQAERETLARMEWRDIESAPKDKYFLAVIDAGETERRLLHALGLADDLADYREIHIAYRRKGDPKRKIRTSPHGRIYTATHWMNLPELPEN